ncbi:MAG: hypothetical protein ACPGID_09775 [Rubricella sp.]
MIRFLVAAAMAGAAALPAVAQGAAQADDHFRHGYVFYVGGIRSAEATVEGWSLEDGYLFNASLRSAGIVGFFADAEWEAEVQGRRLSEASFRPDDYRHETVWNGEIRSLNMDYEGGRPVLVAYTPEREEDDEPIPPMSTAAGTVDPLTGLVMLVWPGTPDEICGRVIDTFSGARRTRLTMSAPRRGGDGTWRCEGGAMRMRYDEEGNRTPERDKTFPFTIEMREMADAAGVFEVWRLNSPTDIGQMIVRRTN